MMKRALLLMIALPAVALAEEGPRGGPPGPMGMHGPGPMRGGPPVGIPPEVAARLKIPEETVKRVRDLGFEANEALIPLEAELKKAQLQLERALAEKAPDEAAVMQRLEAVTRAELSVRKNRMGLMLRIRKQLGPELWQKLEAELPRPPHGGPGMGPGPHAAPMPPPPGAGPGPGFGPGPGEGPGPR